MALDGINRNEEAAAGTVELPAPTSWPIVFAFGLTLLFAGLVTSGAVSVLGAVVALAGAVGWFRDVLPQEALESFRVRVMRLTCIAGLGGLPQVSIPAGTVAGCPAGLSLIGWAGGDEALLDLAVALSRSCGIERV